MKNILEIKNLNKTLNKKEVLKNVSFSVGEGEIYGFLGPNGAGKTTTMKNILRFLKPDSGEIKIFGKNIFDEQSKKQIGFMPENTYLYKHLTGKEFLEFNGKFFGLSGEKLDKKVNKLLKKLGLENAGDKFLKDYSKGMLQRVGLAQAIINDPKLLFLDEPMSGLDPIGRKMVKDLIIELNKFGTTIFFNTHILADVESICDKISIIHNGEIIVKNKKVSEIEGSLEDFFIERVNKKK
ncbi:ABC transporter ATP-binding protein [Candidatus Gracilibacteria bacterium]|nr:MAG: ABC transporter ATP-binding protein [Candidatus Gracilibacteria bacterium]